MPIIVYSGMIIQCFISALTTQYLFTTFVINVSATEQYLQENTNYKKKKKKILRVLCLKSIFKSSSGLLNNGYTDICNSISTGGKK